MSSDILKPDVLWIEGRCYRMNDGNKETAAFQEHDLYDNAVNYEDMEDDEYEDESDIKIVDEGRFSTNIHVSKHYLGSIIGKKAAMKMRIERDTRTDIKIPKHGQDGDVIIFGSTKGNVKAAKRRINIIVMSARMKQRATHFISIPLNNQDIMKRFQEFKESVLTECPSRGLDESLFIRPHKLHLTIGVMCLMDNEERIQASKLFTEAKEKIVIPLLQEYAPIKLRLNGISYMNDDPREIDVLYGRVRQEGNEEGILQTLADGLVDYFCKAGFMKREHGRENVKLHVTLINSKYRNQSATSLDSHAPSSGQQSRQRRVTFDGSEILTKFADFDFGVMELKELHLSTRHSTGTDGFYQPTSILTC